MLKAFIFFCAFLYCAVLPAPQQLRAETMHATFIKQHVPDAAVIGTGDYKYFMMTIYKATLYAREHGWSGKEPFALVLQYQRNLKGERIAKASVDQMRQQGYRDEVKLAAWYNQMSDIFPDVTKGSILIGILKQNGHTAFYQADKKIGHIQDTEFGHRFFDIWLGEKTTAPYLRQKLLSRSAQ